MRHTPAHRLPPSRSSYTSCDARRTQPRQSSTSPRNAHGPCTGRQPQARPPRGAPASARRRGQPRGPARRAPPSPCTNAVPCSAQSSGQTRTSPHRVLPQHSSLHECQRETGEEIHDFCSYFLLKSLFARADIATVAQLESTAPCRGRREYHLGKKKQ